MIEPYTDTQTARDAVRSLTRPKTDLKEIKDIISRLFISDIDICLMALRLLLDNFENLVIMAREPVFKLTEFIFGRTTEISRIIPPLSILVGSRDSDIRRRSVDLVCSVGPLAKPAEDLAMGCLRNHNREIRMCGAKILLSIGSACSRSITRQLRTYMERMKDDTEFCEMLQKTITRIDGETNSESSRFLRRDTTVMVKLLKGCKVLIVDDNQILRETLEEMLSEQFSMTVLQASDGAEAIDLIGMQEPDGIDYVILDLKMPEVNGIRVLQYIREESPIKNVNVIMATAVADARIVGMAQKFGISSYIHKPFRINQLIKVMLESHPKVVAALTSESA